MECWIQVWGLGVWGFWGLGLQAECKAALQRELGLPVRPEVPLVNLSELLP